ncbi:MAG: hypothetical protein C5B53_03590 [Candidatus Melainabacteria bacterium]|nr:MAG: hypothetical protein C5B53_03590 [Candidatus Melainabacteria bacterium]
MDRNLSLKAFIGYLLSLILFGAPIFLAAWTLNYWEAWLFLFVFSIATTWHGLFLAKHDPALLERRMRVGPTAEKRPAQRIIMSLTLVFFIVILVVAGLDHRFGWSHLPAPIVFTGDLLIVLSYFVFYLVCRENSFASATIEITEGQKVVSTGLYGFVRHPMYSGALLMCLGIALALRSAWALLVVLAVLPVLIWRIVDEEKFLASNLQGYVEYCNKVKSRLIPGVY